MSIEEYRANPSKYTFKIAEGPHPATKTADISNVPVSDPDGQIKVKVYVPTDDAVERGGLESSNGLPAHVNYHGGILL